MRISYRSARALLLPALGVACLLAAGCVSRAPLGEDDFSVTGTGLLRGEDAYTLSGVYVPGLAQGGGTLESMAPPLARIAEVGGNTACFDLSGFSADGKSLDPAEVDTVIALADRAKEQHMAVVIRVLAGVKGEEVRLNAVRAAARALKVEARAVYWIDGPNEAELAQVFKKNAPNLVVASSGGPDLRTTMEAGEGGAQTLTMGKLPPVPGEMHFVLDEGDASYALIEQAFINPVETAPWTPDNSGLTEAERNEGFIALFDGKTLNGWWVFGDNKEGFEVSPEGTIRRSGEDGRAIMTRDRYDNFILRLEYKIADGGNSGVFLRAPRASRQSRIGMEFQIHGDMTEQDSDDMTGAIYKVVPPTMNAGRPAEEWNQLEIMLDDRRLKATLNEAVVQDINLDDHEELRYRLKKGFIGLQDHDHPVEFRNVRLKQL